MNESACARDFSFERGLYYRDAEASRHILRRTARDRAHFGAGLNDAVLFHGTSPDAWQEIRTNGLQPRSRRGWQTRPGISFSLDPSYAGTYAFERFMEQSRAEWPEAAEGVLLMVRVEPDMGDTGVDDDFWADLITFAERGEQAHHDILRAYVRAEDIGRLENLAYDAGEEPTEAHEAALAGLLYRGTPLSLSLALRGSGRVCAPIGTDDIVGAWRLTEPRHGRPGGPLAAESLLPGALERPRRFVYSR